MMEIYFDNSATTRVSEAAAQKMIQAAREIWGNPSSLHRMGKTAETVMNEARASVLNALGVPTLSALENRRSLIFTASGTEANNLAILGCAYAKPRNRSRRLIVSDSEHPSVLECALKLEREGYDVYRLSTKGGVLHPDDIAHALEREPFLVSCMTVNNETGARYDIETLFAMAKAVYPRVITHTDAVQAFLHVPLHAADMITVSAHKIHGPKGVGALYVSPSVRKAKALSPVIFGGGQEDGLRSGTENVPSIAGFGEAARCRPDHTAQANVRQSILDRLPVEVRANLPAGSFAPHILSLTMPGIRSETMLHFLEDRGIYVSSGSACSSNTGHGSYVLRAFGLPDAEADATIRLSFDEAVTLQQADAFLAALQEGLATLVRAI